MAAYGFKLQDVSDKTKSAAALAALHAGILRETKAQLGLASAALGTHMGATAALTAAQENLHAAFGIAITRNKAWILGINALAEVMRDLEAWFHKNEQAVADFVTTGLVLFVKGLALAVEGVGRFIQELIYLESTYHNIMQTLREAEWGALVNMGATEWQKGTFPGKEFLKENVEWFKTFDKAIIDQPGVSRQAHRRPGAQ